MKTVFTTGEAAKMCHVSQQTIIRCFDTGQLKGFRVPGSRFRRIPREVLYTFMKENGIPTDAFGPEYKKILGIGLKEALQKRLSAGLDGEFRTTFAGDTFDAGIYFKEETPDCVVIDAGVDQSSLIAMSCRIQANEGGFGIVICGSDHDRAALETLDLEIFQEPFDHLLLIERIRSRLSQAE